MEPFIIHLTEEESARQESYRQYRDYYDGRQGVLLTDRQRKFLHVPKDKEFSANYMHIVVDSLVTRLRVRGFEAGDLTDTLNMWFRHMRINALQGGVHTGAIRDGDAYGFVEWDVERKRPIFIPHLAYDGRDGVHVYYTPERVEPMLFSKRWTVEVGAAGLRRMNLYYPDRMERYWCHASTGDTNWLPGTGNDGSGLPAVSRYRHGFPLIHFTNRARGFRYGMSELEPGIPMQDALNKAIIDMLAAADASGFRIMVMIGGNPSALELAPGSWVYLPDQTPGDANVYQIPGEPLRPHIEVVDAFVQRIAQVTDTPLSYFQQSGQMASEGTHRQHEARMLAKSRSCATELGEQWEDVMRICIRMSNIYDGTDYNEDVEIETLWDDFDIRDKEEKVKARAEAMKALVEATAGLRAAAVAVGFSEAEANAFAEMEYMSLEQQNRIAQPEPRGDFDAGKAEE